MSAPGPVPKDRDQRRRRNKPEIEPLVISSEETSDPIKIPPAKQDWHQLARDWYRSLRKSRQSATFEPSDWQYAVFVAELMSRNLNQGQKISAVLSAQVMAGITALLATPGERRRLNIEFEKATVDPDQVGADNALDDLISRVDEELSANDDSS